MWNKRPEEELSNRFEVPGTGTAPVAESVPAPAPVKMETGRAVIGKGVKIVGEIYTSEDLLIEGFVQGRIEALNQKVTVGPNGSLHGNVLVRELDVQGAVQGNVDASERVDVRNEASLTGDVKAARIVLEDGGYFKGSIDIVRPEPAAQRHAA